MNSIYLITGSRKGIGRFLTEYYLDKGQTVIGFSRTQSDLKHVNYFHFLVDVGVENDVVQAIREIKRRFNRIDVLINNAGIASMNHSLLTPLETVNNLYKTNFLGSFLFSRECSKIMSKQNYGRIVNFTTIACPLNLEGEMVYVAMKSAVEKMTKVMSKELAKFNITVNAIGPTPVYTDLIKVLPKGKVDDIISKQPLKRMGEFKDIANVIDFFISKNSDFISGQVLYLGGL